MIYSNDNPLIKKYQKLNTKKWRQKYGVIPLEGELLINEALQSGIEFEYILYNQEIEETETYYNIIAPLLERKIDCRKVDTKLLQKISFTAQPQGITAVTKFTMSSIDSILSLADNKSVLVLYQVGDPGNLGTLIRSADAFGFEGVICTKGCVDPTNDKVIRSSMGSIFHIPVSMNSSVTDLLSNLENNNYLAIFAEPNNGEDIDTMKMDNSSLALFIGNEVHGFRGLDLYNDIKLMSEKNVQKCKIPMVGKAESLNAGVAGSIIMYEISKKRCD